MKTPRGNPGSALVVSLLFAACVRVTQVPGPDGETARLIECDRAEQCYESAKAECPDGYLVRSSGEEMNGATVKTSGSRSLITARTQLLVSCKADLATAARGDGPKAAPATPREDGRVCDAAAAHLAAFGKYWESRTPGAKALDERPLARDFVAACQGLPENAQRCMHEKYRSVHEKACDAVLSRLDAGSRAKIDALYLEASMGSPPAPAIPAAGVKSL